VCKCNASSSVARDNVAEESEETRARARAKLAFQPDECRVSGVSGSGGFLEPTRVFACLIDRKKGHAASPRRDTKGASDRCTSRTRVLASRPSAVLGSGDSAGRRPTPLLLLLSPSPPPLLPLLLPLLLLLLLLLLLPPLARQQRETEERPSAPDATVVLAADGLETADGFSAGKTGVADHDYVAAERTLRDDTLPSRVPIDDSSFVAVSRSETDRVVASRESHRRRRRSSLDVVVAVMFVVVITEEYAPPSK